MEQPDLLCGVDIGGTKLAVGLVNRQGRVLHSLQTDDHTCLCETGLMDCIVGLIGELTAAAAVPVEALAGIGVGIAGHIRHQDGTVLTTSNLHGFKRYPLARELADRTGKRVLIDNDANCQALAEHRYGAGVGYTDLVFITVSTGIGSGLILNGKLYRGMSGTAGEIGHTIIEPSSEEVCTCGNRGCFMAHASTMNLESLVKRKSARFQASRLLDGLEGDKEAARGNSGGRKQGRLAVDGRLIHEHAGRQDPLALEIMGEYADYLAIMLYNVFQFLNPPLIVMGGGLMNWGDDFFQRMVGRFHELAGPMLYEPLPIVRAGIAKDSGIIGAASLLLE